MPRYKILIVSVIMPYPPIGGAQSKLFHLLRQVSKFHDIDLLLFPWRKPSRLDTEMLRPYVNHLKCIPYKPRINAFKLIRCILSPLPLPIAAYVKPPIRDAIRLALINKYDLLHIEGCFPGLAVLGLKTPPRLIVPHDSFYWNYSENLKMASWRRKPLLALEMVKFRFLEPRMYGYYDAVGMCTSLDALVVRKLNPSLHMGVVSNGVNLSDHTPNPAAEDYPSIVFSGSYDYPPNENAALRLMRHIAPPLRGRWPNLKIFIVGDQPTRRMKKAAAAHPLNFVTGRVEVMSKWIAKGSIYCSPLRYGVGFKNKVPEAWAMKRPLVATPKTMEGINFIHGRDALVADTNEGLVRACTALLNNTNLRKKIGAAGRRRVEERYNWPTLAKDLLNLYEYVASQPRQHR